jgi:hypothetical protein
MRRSTKQRIALWWLGACPKSARTPHADVRTHTRLKEHSTLMRSDSNQLWALPAFDEIRGLLLARMQSDMAIVDEHSVKGA